jgi:hypothetical protein
VAFWFPFTSASSNGTVTYSDTQTLYYNEYWYEKESLSSGQTIEYYMQSIPGNVTFLIWDQPFEDFTANKQLTGSYQENDLIILGNNEYEYLGYFLKKNSYLEYSFKVDGGDIEFFIADSNDLNRWNNWETINYLNYYKGNNGVNGSFTVPHSQDWYLVWYNSGSSSVSIDLSVDYTAEGAFDFSEADVKYENTDLVNTATLTVPRSGNWYFFVYFDPFVNPAESVDITFDVSYHTQVTYDQKWKDISPILLIIGLLIVILLVVAIVQRRSTKQTTPPSTTTAAVGTTPSTTETVQLETTKKCHRCKFPSKLGDVFCSNCGAKLTGRDYGVSTITTPASAKNCHSCGKPLIPKSRFCKHCGAKIELEEKSHKYFPDERKTFFCQLDNEKHPSTDSAYECDQCSRKICGDCYANITKTGVTRCPYCKGDLSKVQ